MADIRKRRTNTDGLGDQQQASKKISTNQPIPNQQETKAEGLKCTLHGVFYQLKLIIVVLLHAKQLLDDDQSIQFNITSEDPTAGKFDDVVLRFSTSPGPGSAVKIQAKHKLDDFNKLSWKHLSIDSKAPFAIVKYFRSFLQQSDAGPIDKDQFVLCTNADMDEQLVAMLEKVDRSNDIIDPIFNTINASRYRFNLGKLLPNEDFQKLLQLMEECTDIIGLAKTLAKHVFNQEKATLNDPLLKKYRKAIGSILQQNSKSQPREFSKEFLEGLTSTAPIGMIEFREAFSKQYQILLPNVSDKMLWDDVKKKGINVTRGVLEQDDDSRTDATGSRQTKDPLFPSSVAVDVMIRQFFSQFILSCNTSNEYLMDKQIQELWSKIMPSNETLLLEQIGTVEKELAYKELFERIFQWLANKDARPLGKDDVVNILRTIRNTIHLLYLKGISNSYCQILKTQELVIDSDRLKMKSLYTEIGKTFSANSQNLEPTFKLNSPYTPELSGSFILSALELCHENHTFEYLIFDDETFLNNHTCMRDVFTSLNSPLIVAVVCINSSITIENLIKEFIDANQSICRRKAIVCELAQPCAANEKYFLVGDLSSDTKKLLEKKYRTLNIFDTLAFQNQVIKDDDSLLMLTTALEQQIQQRKQGSSIEIACSKQKSTYIVRDWEPYVERQDRVVDPSNKKIEFQQLFSDMKEEMPIAELFKTLSGKLLRHYNENLFETMAHLVATIENSQKTVRKIPCDDDQAGLIDNPEKPDEPKQKRKVFIMLNEAGQGKSSYLTWLAGQLKKKEPSMWIIRLNCIDYCTDFERLLVDGRLVTIKSFKALRVLFVLIHLALFVPTIKTQMISDTDLERQIAAKSAQCITYSEGSVVLDEELMVRLGLSFRQRLLLRVFQYKFNNHAMVLLVDGFNEIAPHYKSVTLELLTRYREFRGIVKMYITCRPYNFQKLFESSFPHALFFQLTVLRLEEKCLILHSFAINSISKNHPNTNLGNYYDALIALITIAITRSVQELSDVPLFLRIAMEELLPVIEKHVDFTIATIKRTLFKEIDMALGKVHLVNTIIDRIIRIAVLEKTGVIDMPSTSPYMMKIVEDIILILKIRYKLLALWVMFSDNERKSVLNALEYGATKDFLNQIQEGSDKTGIVKSVQGYIPIFGQRLFAEYFAAEWILEDRKRTPNRCFHTCRAYWSQEQLNMRRFIDTILLGNSEKYPLHMAVIEGDEDKIKAILRAQPDTAFQKDPKARTVLHLAALYPVSEDVLDLFPNNVEQSFINAWEKFIPTSLLSLAFLMDNGKMIWYCLCEGASIEVHLLKMQMTCTKDMMIFLVGRFDFHVMSYLYEHGLHETDAGKSTLEAMIELCDKVIQKMVNEKAIDFYDPEYVGGIEKETFLERLSRLDAVLLLKSFVKNAEGLQNLYIGIDRLFQKALDSSAFFVMEYLICECNFQAPPSTKKGKLMKCIEAGKKNKDSAIYKTLVKEFCDEHRQARITMDSSNNY